MTQLDINPKLIEAADLEYSAKLDEIKTETNNQLGRAAINANRDGMLHSTGYQQVVFKILRDQTYAALQFRGDSDFEALVNSTTGLNEDHLEWLLKRQDKAFDDFKPYLAKTITNVGRGNNSFIPPAEKFLADNPDLQDKLEKAKSALKVKYLRHEPTKSVAGPMTAVCTKDFSFMHSDELKSIAERDVTELCTYSPHEAPKTTIIMAGSIIENLLLDRLLTMESAAKAALSGKPKVAAKDLETWNLEDLIDAAFNLNIITGDITQFNHSVRNYRNLIHPGREIRHLGKPDGITVNAHTAGIAINVLNLVIDTLRASRTP